MQMRPVKILEREDFTDSAEKNKKNRVFVKTIGGTEFTVIVEESENARETALKKFKRLIDRNCDKIIFEQKRNVVSANHTNPLEGCIQEVKNE